MSQWTQIRGTLTLNGESSRLNEDKNECIPYPTKQMKLRVSEKSDVDENTVEYYLSIYSLANWKDRIDKAMKLLPQGEYDCISYSLYQDDHGSHCSSSKLNDYEKRALNENKNFLINHLDFDSEYCESFKTKKEAIEYSKTNNIKVLWTEYYSLINLTIVDSVRDCSCSEMAYYLEKSLRQLITEGATLVGGYLEWGDDYKDKLLYTLVTEDDWSSEVINITVYKVNKKTKKEVAHKKIYVDRNWNSAERRQIISFKEEKSKHWRDYIEEEQL